LFSSKALLATCRALATTLDNRAVEENKQKKTVQAKALWSKAQQYYLRSANGAPEADVAQIAERLMVIGMIVNNIDEKVEGWFETPDFRVTSGEAWENALELYSRLAGGGATSYKSRVGRARILGFMGRWAECESELRQLFNENKNLLAANGKLDSRVLSDRRELLSSYLEWGFALCKPTQGGDEKSRRNSASDVFNRIAKSVPPDSKHGWYARYGQIQTLYDRGLYDEASVSMASLERTNPELEGNRFGLQGRFKTLKVAIQSKKPAPTPKPK